MRDRNIYWFEDEIYECNLCKGFLATETEIQRQICDNCWEDNDNPYDEYIDYGVSPGDIREEK